MPGMPRGNPVRSERKQPYRIRKWVGIRFSTLKLIPGAIFGWTRIEIMTSIPPTGEPPHVQYAVPQSEAGLSGGGPSLLEDPSAYRQLARKYRPARFEDLVGQDVIVATLQEAFKQDRLAQAFLLTGTRGVGKTTLARILARCFNCVEGASTSPCGRCDPCIGIEGGKSLDVLEIDAASHNSVDHIRELTEAIRYRPATCRYRVYILDEVHMLSTQAFNALLKSLEEPPQHAKFIFATTEFQKLPKTVISRCQRFNLQAVPESVLAAHLHRIAKAEGAELDDEGMRIMVRAADGSVRDGLSILDQAINLGRRDGGETQTKIDAGVLREMLGLPAGEQSAELLSFLASGKVRESLDLARLMVRGGATPDMVVRDLMHRTWKESTRRFVDSENSEQLGRTDHADPLRAVNLTFPDCSRIYQLLLKVWEDQRDAPSPQEAMEMGLLRLLHAVKMPLPAELASRLAERIKEDSAAVSPIGASGSEIRQKNNQHTEASESQEKFDKVTQDHLDAVRKFFPDARVADDE